ncbi:hypothetical protein [Novosphingobium sp.]|uniref:hypothetical protein n=1 Tax=Novosphingobium sp. TaxID=1874826 RepID=UPI0031DCDA7A
MHASTPYTVTIDPEMMGLRRHAALSGLLDLLDQLPDDAHLPPRGIAAILALSLAPDEEPEGD